MKIKVGRWSLLYRSDPGEKLERIYIWGLIWTPLCRVSPWTPFRLKGAEDGSYRVEFWETDHD